MQVAGILLFKNYYFYLKGIVCRWRKNDIAPLFFKIGVSFSGYYDFASNRESQVPSKSLFIWKQRPMQNNNSWGLDFRLPAWQKMQIGT